MNFCGFLFTRAFLVWCCQLGNRQLTISPFANFEALSRHHCGPDGTVCVQVVLEVRPAPVYPALRSAAGRCRRQLDPRKFRIALAVARVVAIIALSLTSKFFTCSPLDPPKQNPSKGLQISCSRKTEFASSLSWFVKLPWISKETLIYSSKIHLFRSNDIS